MLSDIVRKASAESKQHQLNMFHGETFLYIFLEKPKCLFSKHSKLNIDFIFVYLPSLSCTLYKSKHFSLARSIIIHISFAESHKTIIDGIHLCYFLFLLALLSLSPWKIPNDSFYFKIYDSSFFQRHFTVKLQSSLWLNEKERMEILKMPLEKAREKNQYSG